MLLSGAFPFLHFMKACFRIPDASVRLRIRMAHMYLHHTALRMVLHFDMVGEKIRLVGRHLLRHVVEQDSVLHPDPAPDQLRALLEQKAVCDLLFGLHAVSVNARHHLEDGVGTERTKLIVP